MSVILPSSSAVLLCLTKILSSSSASILCLLSYILLVYSVSCQLSYFPKYANLLCLPILLVSCVCSILPACSAGSLLCKFYLVLYCGSAGLLSLLYLSLVLLVSCVRFILPSSSASLPPRSSQTACAEVQFLVGKEKEP